TVALELGGRSLTKTGSRPVLEVALIVLEEAKGADDYAVAGRLLAVARKAAPNARIVLERDSHIEVLRKEYEKLREAVQTLTTNPKDPAANLAVGRFQCFSKGDWDKGLPMLAAGSDAGLADLAKKDLSKPTDPAVRVEVGEGWLERARKEACLAQTWL